MNDHNVLVVHRVVAVVNDVVATVVNHVVFGRMAVRPIGQQGGGGKGEERQEHSG